MVQNVACNLKQVANQNNLCFTAHQAIVTGYLSVRSSNPQAPSRCSRTWSPQILLGTANLVREVRLNSMQFNASVLSSVKGSRRSNPNQVHHNLGVEPDQRETQKKSRSLQRQRNSKRSHQRTTRIQSKQDSDNHKFNQNSGRGL